MIPRRFAALLVAHLALAAPASSDGSAAEPTRQDDAQANPASALASSESRQRLVDRVRAVMDDPKPLVAQIRIDAYALDENDRVQLDRPRSEGDRGAVVQYLDGRWRSTSDRGRVMISDGTLLWNLDPRSRVAYVSSSINHSDEALLEIALQREGFYGWSAVPTFAAALEEAEFVSIKETDDSIHAVYEIPRESSVLPRRFRYEITVVQDPIRIESFSSIGPARAGAEGWSPPVIFRVREWTAIDDRPLARIADRWIPGTGVVSRFTLVSARVPAPEEAAAWVFAGPREPGWRVVDSRLRLEWVIGERTVTVSGQRFRLAEPLVEHPGDRLAELLATAERFDGSDP